MPAPEVHKIKEPGMKEKEEITESMLVINQETGQIRGVKRETKHYPIPKKIEFTTPEGKKVVHETGYDITKGSIIFKGKDITKAKADERAKLGLFLSFQYPQEVSGVTYSSFLRTALKSNKQPNISVIEFHKLLHEKMRELDMDEKFAQRYLNEGFSGGEKKRSEILQMAVLNPKYAILDETDSGLDINSIKIVGESVNKMRGPQKGILIITHYYRILNYITPDQVSILINGKIVKTGGKELALEIEHKGFDNYIKAIEVSNAN